MIPRLKADLGFSEVLAALSFWKKGSVQEFEKSFSQLVQQKFAFAFGYGRTGLVVLLKAMGLEGQEIICPAYTCVVVPHAIVTAGCTPVFVDSKEEDFNMDWALIEQAVTSKTGAVIATSIFGCPVNLDSLDNFRKNHPDIRIIQDCAHSFCAEWNGRAVQHAGDAAFFGLNISKIMTSIFGGMVTTDDPLLAERLIQQRNELLSPSTLAKSFKRLLYLLAVIPAFWRPIYGGVNRLERSGILNHFVKYFDANKIDMPDDYLTPMSGVEARVGSVQCEKYPKIIKHRRKLAALYSSQLQQIHDFQLPATTNGSTFSHYVIRTKNAKNILEICLHKGIQLGELIDYYIPDMKAYITNQNIGDRRAAQWPEKVINLPLHLGVNSQDANNLAQLLKRIQTTGAK